VRGALESADVHGNEDIMDINCRHGDAWSLDFFCRVFLRGGAGLFLDFLSK